ncbi:MAG: tRNA (adenosine(37)-N6)-threonylcarbamoyltransferase complex transferase subunit TsaD [Candidatus Doudnabacteria bacterium]|nr:tRNA (adenosine(37)-N6)-threonylcarbamoyltransferase complex transferase subunit TsaD [Candidatus Doudnabacteria bacterium]
MSKKDKKVILAIESSCDETAAAVLEINLSLNPSPRLPGRQAHKGGTGTSWPEITTLSSVVKSQIALHKSYGGVVPEVAARAHVKNIRPVVEHALQALPTGQAGSSYKLEAIDYIAVTAGPGLIPSLIVGVEFAKALSLASGIPLLPTNHMLGHLYSPFGRVSTKSQNPNNKSEKLNPKSLFPNISLIVSGGHTMIVLMKNEKTYKVLGQTVDDAAGEAFDKVAKLLNLPYPGGPEVSRLALSGNPKAINFPRPMLNSKNYDFSFSGLKTAVLYYVRSLPTTNYSLQTKSDISASFQAAAVDVLVQKTMRAAKEFKAKSVSLSGGVSANRLLRSELETMSNKLGIKFFVPPFNLCTDNAEMIGIAAAFALHNGKKPTPYKKVKADSNWEI